MTTLSSGRRGGVPLRVSPYGLDPPRYTAHSICVLTPLGGTPAALHYYANKEDILLGWQLNFRDAPMTAHACPPGKPLMSVVHKPISSALEDWGMRPRALEIQALIQSAPALSARDHLPFIRTEVMLAAVLSRRVGDQASALRLLRVAMIVVGVLRVATEDWIARRMSGAPGARAMEVLAIVWSELPGNLESPDPA